MWKILSYAALLPFISGCADQPENKAVEIVKKSIEAHGGWAAWEKATHLVYEKTTILFDTAGQMESSSKQTHAYQLRPVFTGKITWGESDGVHKIGYDGENATESLNGQPVEGSVRAAKALTSIVSAHYVFCQPFKLLDPGAGLSYLGRDTLEGQQIVDVVQASYKSSPTLDPPDVWWYYFDVATRLLAANMVKHGETYSFIVNLEYDKSTPLIFNRHRKSYMVDSARNVLYLRAEYFNENIRLE